MKICLLSFSVRMNLCIADIYRLMYVQRGLNDDSYIHLKRTPIIYFDAHFCSIPLDCTEQTAFRSAFVHFSKMSRCSSTLQSLDPMFFVLFDHIRIFIFIRFILLAAFFHIDIKFLCKACDRV